MAIIRWAVLIFVAFAYPAHAECLHSAQEVRDQHPGAWPSWHGPRSAKCWYPDFTHRTRTAAKRSRPKTATPLPRPRPDVELQLALRQPKALRADRAALVDMFDEIMAADSKTRRAWALNGEIRVEMFEQTEQASR
jgi:hypothetical protein